MQNKTCRINSKGQITIPQHIRVKYGFLPNTRVRFKTINGQLVLLKAEGQQSKNGNELIQKMTSKEIIGMTTAEIMKLTRS